MGNIFRFRLTAAFLAALAVLGLTGTARAAAPSAADFTGVTLSQIQANWTPNGNPGGSTYVAVLSTGPSPDTNGFSGNQSSTTVNQYAVFPGLALNTTYYIDVREQSS